MRGIFFLFFCMLFLIPATVVQAHGVRVFAWSEGEKINVEAAFRGGRPARQAEIIVREAESGDVLLHGLTNEEGLFHFPIPSRAREAKLDLEIIVDCGTGHIGQWLLAASDYLEILDNPIPSVKKDQMELNNNIGGEKPVIPASDLHEEQIRLIIADELDKKLGPIKRQLYESQQKTDIRDIFGGIGWLLGFAGIAAWFKSKRKE